MLATLDPSMRPKPSISAALSHIAMRPEPGNAGRIDVAGKRSSSPGSGQMGGSTPLVRSAGLGSATASSREVDYRAPRYQGANTVKT